MQEEINVSEGLGILAKWMQDLIAGQSVTGETVTVRAEDYIDIMGLIRDWESYTRDPEAYLQAVFESNNPPEPVCEGNVVSFSLERKKRRNRKNQERNSL